MADDSQQTPPNTNPEGTGGGEPQVTPPTATQPKGQSGAATDDNEMITISQKDYKELQAQRDRNHQRATASEEYAITQMQKDDINAFLGTDENKKKFPDVEVDDLMVATDPEEFEQIAAQTQARIDKAAQRRLADIEKATDPVLSPEEKAAKLKKLKENPGVSSLEQAIELSMQ